MLLFHVCSAQNSGAPHALSPRERATGFPSAGTAGRCRALARYARPNLDIGPFGAGSAAFTEAKRHIANQREIVAQKERDGHDTATSKQLLDQFKHLYRMHVADRDRLEKELDEASK